MAIIEQKKNFTKLIIGGIIGLILLIIISSSFYVVNPGEVSFVKRLGEIQEGTYTEGLHWKTPFIERVVITSIKEKKNEVRSTSSSKDLQDVTTIIAVNYALTKDKVIPLYQEVGGAKEVERILIAPAIQESIKSATAKFTASELITERAKVRGDIVEGLKAKLENRGIMVGEVNIIEFKFSDSFNIAIEEKVKAEQQAQKAKNDLARVEFEAQQQIEKAKAEAEKIKIQAEAITKQGGAEYVKLQRIAKWDGKLPQYMLSDGKNLMLMTK